LLSVKTAQIWF